MKGGKENIDSIGFFLLNIRYNRNIWNWKSNHGVLVQRLIITSEVILVVYRLFYKILHII